MKISVVADESGTVIAAVIPPLEPVHGRPFFSIQPQASKSHKVHEADLPEELFEHLGKDTLIPKLFQYRVEKKGKRSVLKRR